MNDRFEREMQEFIEGTELEVNKIESIEKLEEFYNKVSPELTHKYKAEALSMICSKRKTDIRRIEKKAEFLSMTLGEQLFMIYRKLNIVIPNTKGRD